MSNLDNIVSYILNNINEVGNILRSEPQLVEVSGDKIVVVGDLHGDLPTLREVLTRYRPREWKLVFLGDYVDRGEYQIETLVEVLRLKQEYPECVVLLRGNHESPLMNIEYGFVWELQQKLGEDKSFFLYQLILREVFSNLPYAALVNGRYLMLHGGLATGVTKLSQIRDLPKGDEEPRNRIAFQILWNDPSDEVRGFVPNYLRGCDPSGLCVYFWGPDVTESFLQENAIELIVRAHEYTAEGYKWNHNGKVLTVFSSRAGPYRFVRPKILKIERDKIDIVSVYS